MAQSPNEIRELLASYLANESDIENFEDMIAQKSWNIHQCDNQSAQRLAYEIEAALAEFSSDRIDESALRKRLSPLVTDYTPELHVDWAFMISASESSNLTAQSEIPMAVSAPLGEEFAKEP